MVKAENILKLRAYALMLAIAVPKHRHTTTGLGFMSQTLQSNVYLQFDQDLTTIIEVRS
jgi:hypothetical protein